MVDRNSLILLGKKLKVARLNKGFSQEELSFRASISTQYLSDVERGIRNISAINLMKIAKSLEIEVGDLFPPISQI